MSQHEKLNSTFQLFQINFVLLKKKTSQAASYLQVQLLLWFRFPYSYMPKSELRFIITSNRMVLSAINK